MDLGAHDEEGDATMPMMAADFVAALRESSSSSKAKLATRRRGTAVNVIRPPQAGDAEADKKIPKYSMCLKNLAASSGGYALDGCGEFMAAGAEGTPEALKCATCDCHRNFHRKEEEGESSRYCRHTCKECGGQQQQQPPEVVPHPPSPTVSPVPAPTTLMTLRNGASVSGGATSARKKRFRAKYSMEQKEKMCAFADKAGWKLPKEDETAVQALCTDLGVTRNALKVWMHNNKRTLGTDAEQDKRQDEPSEP